MTQSVKFPTRYPLNDIPHDIYPEEEALKGVSEAHCYNHRNSPHLAHHAAIQRQTDIEKQFNYTGSNVKSPHHDPLTKIQQKLQSNIQLDQDFNNSGGRYSQPRPKTTQNTLMQYPQPYGSGDYSNQLILRTTQSKTGVDFESQPGKVKRTTKSSAGNRFSLGDSMFSSIMQGKKTQESLRRKLYFDERTKTVPKSTIKNGIIEDIVSEGEVFVANKQLMNSVYQLKRLNLLKQHESHVNRFPGIGKSPYVFNDYHSKSTNNGYSRQEKGGYFFTK